MEKRIHTNVVRAVAAEGARIGLLSCHICGAAIVVDPSDDVDRPQLHMDWHQELDNEKGKTMNNQQCALLAAASAYAVGSGPGTSNKAEEIIALAAKFLAYLESNPNPPERRVEW
jgi:hypothetical protein